MSVDITIPSPGESITEVTVGTWMKQSGDWVDKDEIILEIESDKATLEITSPAAGLLTATGATGDELAVGEVIGAIDTSATKPAASASAASAPEATTTTQPPASADSEGVKATPVARKIAADEGVNLTSIKGTGPSGRITKADVLAASASAPPAAAEAAAPAAAPAATPEAPVVIPRPRPSPAAGKYDASR